MNRKRKPTYAQALALEKANAARAGNRRLRQVALDAVPAQSDVERAAWNAAYHAALERYRESRAGR